jgi:hypothetical protein
MAAAVVGGAGAYIGLLLACEVAALAFFSIFGTDRFWLWMKGGLLVSILSMGAPVQLDLHLPVGVPQIPSLPTTSSMRLVPMLTTILFLFLATWFGRRAVRAGTAGSAPATAAIVAAVSAVTSGTLVALAAPLVSLSSPSFGFDVRIDPAEAAAWTALVTAVGTGLGAYLEASRETRFTAAVRGGLSGYGLALGFALVVLLLVAALEPTFIERFRLVPDLLGEEGTMFIAGYHLLAAPGHVAASLVPATGSCLEIHVEVIAAGEAARLCPWEIHPSGALGNALLVSRTALSPAMWLLNIVSPLGAAVGGWRAARSPVGRRGILLGAAAGGVFGVALIAIAAFASPTVLPLTILGHVPGIFPLSAQPSLEVRTLVALGGVTVAGMIGGWVGRRGYEEPELPRPTSA